MDLTYQFDVAPHMLKARMYRTMRKERSRDLSSAHFWRLAIPSLVLLWALVAYGLLSL
jgi:hypothetical protein